ncbi:hypothetical protein CARUB_v10021031mg [Capsella rubella]|uniref:DUF4228 domain-containing protein n=1 Tax=Capsella rubella TaxID=81985 RepID=R0IC96_9BRAS|nr:uncharacterized protein LOC17894078 [Capsella rubella]EOA35800.1 hypothetical protein CARUB_v10021031mg [Capsella rubella]
MGNCQAVDAAALVLQHPDGKIDRYYGPISVSEVMRMYPGHYVSLIIPLPETTIPATTTTTTTDDKSVERRVVRFTRVKLLRPTENLVLGHAYRLITSQEVMKILKAKKYAKTKKHQSETTREKKKPSLEKKINEESDKNQNLETKDEKQRSMLTSSASSKSKTWRPSLQSISEATS